MCYIQSPKEHRPAIHQSEFMNRKLLISIRTLDSVCTLPTAMSRRLRNASESPVVKIAGMTLQPNQPHEQD